MSGGATFATGITAEELARDQGEHFEFFEEGGVEELVGHDGNHRDTEARSTHQEFYHEGAGRRSGGAGPYAT